MPELVLASASPRRAELLRQVGLSFRVVPAEIDETPRADEDARAYVLRMAEQKALRVAPQCTADQVVLAADTSVILDGAILGKPIDAADAQRMLLSLADRTHQVLTAIAAARGGGRTAESEWVQSEVEFLPISASDAERYVNTGEGLDKAGGYGIQGIGSIFVRRLRGSYSAVVGLPLAETELMLRRFEIDTWCLRSP